MSQFYANYPVEGGSSGGVTTLNGLSGALTLIAGSGITITPSGSSITIASTGGGGANTFLSNLSTPTAINTNLYFLTGGSATIGTFDAVQADLNLAPNANGVGSGVNTGNLFLSTEAATGGGVSGNILLTTSGKIQFNDGSQGTAGYVWTSTDTVGSGTWLPAGGANTFLSNLTSPTAINQDLIFATVTANITTQDSSSTSSNLNVMTGNATGGSGNAGGILVQTGNASNGASGDVQVGTGTGSSISGSLSLITGVGGTNSGNILLQPGSAAARGVIRFADGSEGTAGYVWTSTDVNGSGTWAAPGGGNTPPAGRVNAPDLTTGNSVTQIAFTPANAIFDSTGSFGTNVYTAPATGAYWVNMEAFIASTSANSLGLYYTINGGGFVQIMSLPNPGGGIPFANSTILIQLNSGDTLRFYGVASIDPLTGIFLSVAQVR